MGFVYIIDILDLLKKSGYNTTTLRQKKLLSESAIQDIRRGKVVGINTLEKICALTGKQPGDLIEYKRG